MTKKELDAAYAISIEEFAGGFILADYSGNFGKFGVRYIGRLSEMNDQPQINNPFSSEEEALKAAEEYVKVLHKKG